MQTVKFQIFTRQDIIEIVEELVAKHIARQVDQLSDSFMNHLENKLPKKKEKALSLEDSVELLALSSRPIHILNNANISTIGQLVGKTENELRRLRNCGRRAVLEIKVRLAVAGYELAAQPQTNYQSTEDDAQ